MEHRARVLDLAAFLDRVDRAQPDTSGASGAGAGAAGGRPSPAEDFRMTALRRAIAVLGDGKPDRARRILELLSDPTTEPVPAAPMKGATGAYAPPDAGAR